MPYTVYHWYTYYGYSIPSGGTIPFWYSSPTLHTHTHDWPYMACIMYHVSCIVYRVSCSMVTFFLLARAGDLLRNCLETFLCCWPVLGHSNDDVRDAGRPIPAEIEWIAVQMVDHDMIMN